MSSELTSKLSAEMPRREDYTAEVFAFRGCPKAVAICMSRLAYATDAYKHATLKT